jgi:tRNA pseudouridine55 synthase
MKRPLTGVLLFDKPLHLSSNTAMQKVRRLFRAEKAGHTGTLDPLATGLLPICFGEATKFSAGMLDADKRYRARLKLGQTSSTGDAEGEILVTGGALPDEAQAHAILPRFIGEIEQIPPMYSALKHQGKPLYEYIRKGETIDRPPRRVIIHELTLENFAGDEMTLDVCCSKGTYIRTLAEDIGKALGCGAHLLALRRTATANFNLENAYTLEQLDAMSEEQRDACLLPADSLLQNLPTLELDDEQARRMGQGQKLAIETHLPDGNVRLYHAGNFIGVAELQEGRRLVPRRLMAQESQSES